MKGGDILSQWVPAFAHEQLIIKVAHLRGGVGLRPPPKYSLKPNPSDLTKNCTTVAFVAQGVFVPETENNHSTVILCNYYY